MRTIPPGVGGSVRSVRHVPLPKKLKSGILYPVIK